MLGYLRQPQRTADSLHEGWYITGDIALLDDEGFLRITDRVSRFSKIAGEMVPHLKVEEAIAAALGDAPCAVTSIPDEQRGGRLVALYIAPAVCAADLWQRLNASELPRLCIPKRDNLYPVESLPQARHRQNRPARAQGTRTASRRHQRVREAAPYESFLLVCLIFVLVVRWVYLRNRLYELEERINVLSPGPRPVSERIVYPPPPRPVPPAPTPAPQAASPAAPSSVLPRSPSAVAPAAPPRDWESIVGGNWLNKAGVVVLVIGIALALVYSYAHLGPAGRVALSFATRASRCS